MATPFAEAVWPIHQPRVRRQPASVSVTARSWSVPFGDAANQRIAQRDGRDCAA